MSVAIRLGVAVAALLSGCTRDLSNKDACKTTTDCVAGYSCVVGRCRPSGAGIDGGPGGSTGTTDGGADAVSRMCPANPVTSCPGDPGTSCQETFCGGHIRRNGVMKSMLLRYRILDEEGKFSTGYRGAIHAAADAWTRASANLVTFEECTVCTGGFISVVPGNDGEDGIRNPDALEQVLPMPVSGRVSPHRIAHQWGHAVGLSHTYQRADRERYVRFNPEIWCGGSGLPPRCAAGPAIAPGIPPVTTGTFGAFDGKSKMNGLPSEGICGAEEPDEDSGEPTIGDVSAAAELLFGPIGLWAPFRPIGQSVSPTAPLDYQLAPGVDPVGSPAVAEIAYASPEIFVRGTDDSIYTTARSDLLTSEWFAWARVTDDADADPAVTFSYLAVPETLFLAVRSGQDGNIFLYARRAGTWGAPTSLGAPPSGAASGAALASESPSSLSVLVRGGDGLIYRLACMDATSDCASSASQASAWQPLPPPPSGIFVGKPSAVWLRDASGLTVAAIRDDRVPLLMTRVNAGGGSWLSIDNGDIGLAPNDPNPSVAITMVPTPGDVDMVSRSRQGLLVVDTLQEKPMLIGGVIVSAPSAVAIYGLNGAMRTDVAAIIDDHGRPGVWWRYNDGNYTPPCHYNRPGTCLECGL